MTILHTSDWHLGQKLMGKSRQEEHHAFLTWLLEQITHHAVDVLIVAGDIFDTGTPPNYALESYYGFLNQLQETPCKMVIIIAGNHDAISTLQTTQSLLQRLNVYIIASGEEEHTLIPYYEEGTLQALFCAIPFLREGVIRQSIAKLSSQEKEEARNHAIRAYYERIYHKAQTLKKEASIPIIATGHLTTVGAKMSDSERNLYIGNERHIDSAFLAEMFDYVALGHLHHAQSVSSERVRYSGSPIPLSFSEANKEKSVTLISFSHTTSPNIQTLPIPTYRPLYRLKGDLQTLKKALHALPNPKGWIEVTITDENSYKTLEDIEAIAKEKQLTLLAKKIEQSTMTSPLQTSQAPLTLESLTPKMLFQKRLEQEKLTDEGLIEALQQTFETIENEVATQ